MNDIEAARKARRAYQKEWRAKNPDKVKAATERYWIKKAAEMEAAEQKGVDADEKP